MIPAMNIVAWGQTVPWVDQRQVEQDLIISRALIELFNDPFLKEQLRFRGGTALNKLHFPTPLRYSEDIDLVRTTAGSIGPILDVMRTRLEPWMGRAKFDQSPVAPKLRFRMTPEDQSSGVPIRVKVEVNTHEITAYEPPRVIPYAVKNPWFTGKADVATFSTEEILATKLRALLQRDKGRDLIDLAHAKTTFKALDAGRVVTCFGKYLAASGQAIRARRRKSACSISLRIEPSWPTCARCSRRTRPKPLTTRPGGRRSASCFPSSSSAFPAIPGRKPAKRPKGSAWPIWPGTKARRRAGYLHLPRATRDRALLAQGA
jgi:predicted nucleotidyltransferase component of viral defense system